ncbi:MAG: exonuclease [Cyanobacteria bacterium P01_G01_bin.67]
MDFIVIDTEGTRELREIAILDSSGVLIYEAFSQANPDLRGRGLSTKPLATILTDFKEIAAGKIIVFHHAEHDLKVLSKSFKKANLSWETPREVRCTYKLARQLFPNSRYSLAYLATKLGLKVNHQYFNPRQAHIARFDAQFTHQLYLALSQTMTSSFSKSTLVNPFGSSRVDHPFQIHPDNTNVYQTQYAILESVIDDIKYDQNQQSKGAVIVGQPGTGKTHLIMRLARQRLKLNRLLFIPCPNDANTIKYHIYSCILESLNQQIPGTEFNQLEYFLANTFVGIIKSTSSDNQKIITILNKIEHDPLKLYEILGGKDTQAKRNNWDYVEKFTSDWWFQEYGAAGYAPEIIKGIVKFCRYSDPRYKQLVKKWLAADELEPEELTKIGLSSWQDEISKEDFSLDAIAVLGKLSLLHEPLIMVFDQLEMLGLKHNQPILLNFGEAVKEIFTRVPYSLIIFNLFPNRWQQLQQTFDGSIIDRISQYQIFLEPPTADSIQEILQLKAATVGSDLASLFTPQELQQIMSDKRSIRAVLNQAGDYFRYKYKQIPLPDRPQEIANDPAENPAHSAIITRLEQLESQQHRLEQLLHNIAQAFQNFTVVPTSETSELKLENNFSVPATADPNKSQFNFAPSLETKVVNYLEAQQALLAQNYHDAEILLDERDIGKLQDIIEAFKHLTNLETDILPSKSVFPPHRIITNKNICIAFLSSCKGSKFTSRIQNFNELVATREQIKFYLWRDVRSDRINPKTIGSREIDKLNNTKNGEFRTFDRHHRLIFELIYRFISDVYNQDLEIDIEAEFASALTTVANQYQDYWLIKALLN